MSAPTVSEPKVELPQAVKIAKDYLAKVYRDTPIVNVLLEEIELSEDSPHWLVTLGFDDPAIRGGIGAALAAQMQIGSSRRIYKTFKVHTETGRVSSMKIRSVP